MLLKEIAILLGGFVFLAIGIWTSRFYKWKRIKGYIPIIIGIILIYLPTLGPLSESAERLDEIRNIDESKVKMIVFQPTAKEGYQARSIFKENHVIDDPDLICKICQALRQTEIEGEGFMKNPKLLGRAEIHFSDKRIVVLGIRKSGNLTSINLSSDGEDGWNYAKLEANELGKLINDLHQAEIKKKKDESKSNPSFLRANRLV